MCDISTNLSIDCIYIVCLSQKPTRALLSCPQPVKNNRLDWGMGLAKHRCSETVRPSIMACVVSVNNKKRPQNCWLSPFQTCWGGVLPTCYNNSSPVVARYQPEVSKTELVGCCNWTHSCSLGWAVCPSASAWGVEIRSRPSHHCHRNPHVLGSAR